MRSLKLFLTFLLAFTLLCAGPARSENTVGPTAQIICNKVAQLPVGSSALTQMIAAVAGQSIFICGWHVTNTASSGVFSFSYGTGANCASGTTAVIPLTNVTSSAPSADHISLASFQIPAGNAFCITPIVTISAIVYYSQF